ncbi:MAG TPA: hypothetical protein VGC36_12970 [Rhizomicrobium sp.]
MWITQYIDWILIVAGVLTCSMLLMALAPRLAMRTTFGEDETGTLANLIARSWGILIFASGLMLIYAAFHAEVRLPILLYSIVGKLTFVALLVSEPRYRGRALPTIVVDTVIVVLLSWYLLVR